MDIRFVNPDFPPMDSPADVIDGTYDGIQIDSLPPLEHFVVRTRNSSYDVIVVSGREGKVAIRGGRLFPEFRRAQLVGATGGGHVVKMLGVYVGFCLELFADRRSVVTSPVVEILRTPFVETTSTH